MAPKNVVIRFPLMITSNLESLPEKRKGRVKKERKDTETVVAMYRFEE